MVQSNSTKTGRSSGKGGVKGAARSVQHLLAVKCRTHNPSFDFRSKDKGADKSQGHCAAVGERSSWQPFAVTRILRTDGLCPLTPKVTLWMRFRRCPMSNNVDKLESLHSSLARRRSWHRSTSRSFIRPTVISSRIFLPVGPLSSRPKERSRPLNPWVRGPVDVLIGPVQLI